jgi:Na+-driven multidrug efflux pump
MSLTVIVKSRHIYNYEIKNTRLYKKELGEILFIGIPAGLQQSMYSLANVVIVSTVNAVGASATTGLSIANNFDGILYQIAVAPAHAATPYIAQNVGAKNFGRAKKSVWCAMGVAIMFAGTLGALSAIFSPWLSSLMSKDPEVIMYSCQKMMIVSSTYFICGINEIMNGTMRGIGKPIIPTVNTFLFMCAIRFPWVYLIFPLFPQSLTFLYLIWPIGWVIALVSNLIFYIPSMKKLERENRDV